MAFHTLQLTPKQASVPQYLLDKHYYRKHGANAYYGQRWSKKAGYEIAGFFYAKKESAYILNLIE